MGSREKFIKWMKEFSGRSISTIGKYAGAIETISRELESYSNTKVDIYSINYSNDVEILKDLYLSIDELREKNIRGNRMYTCSLDWYEKYLDSKVERILEENIYQVSDEKEREIVNDILGSSIINEEKGEYKLQKKHKKDAVISKKGKVNYPRDHKILAKAIRIANYQCEVEKEHKSFTRRTNRKNYTEAHHLIPMNCQGDFEYSLDIEENICSLCSNCHNCLHYGVDEERFVLLEKLYNERKDYLYKCGIGISFEKLKTYYNIVFNGDFEEDK